MSRVRLAISHACLLGMPHGVAAPWGNARRTIQGRAGKGNWAGTVLHPIVTEAPVLGKVCPYTGSGPLFTASTDHDRLHSPDDHSPVIIPTDWTPLP